MSIDRDEDYMTKLYISNKPEVKKKYISPLIESYEYDDVDGELLVASPEFSSDDEDGDDDVGDFNLKGSHAKGTGWFVNGHNQFFDEEEQDGNNSLDF